MQKFINHGQIVKISLEQTKRYCSKSTATYYEILGIPKDASKKDVKEAFIKLSKKIHPDKSNETSAKSHNDFVKINEAYRVLSKDYSRQQYDSHLRYSQGQDPSSFRAYNPQGDDPYSRSNAYYRSNSFYQDAYRIRYQQQQRRASPHDKNFTPSRIVLYCFLISLVGSILQLWAVIKSPVFNRDQMDRRSEQYFNEYRRVREQVVNNNTKILHDLLNNTEFDSDDDNKNNNNNNNDNYNDDDIKDDKW